MYLQTLALALALLLPAFPVTGDPPQSPAAKAACCQMNGDHAGHDTADGAACPMNKADASACKNCEDGKCADCCEDGNCKDCCTDGCCKDGCKDGNCAGGGSGAGCCAKDAPTR